MSCCDFDDHFRLAAVLFLASDNKQLADGDSLREREREKVGLITQLRRQWERSISRLEFVVFLSLWIEFRANLVTLVLVMKERRRVLSANAKFLSLDKSLAD